MFVEIMKEKMGDSRQNTFDDFKQIKSEEFGNLGKQEKYANKRILKLVSVLKLIRTEKPCL